MNEIKPAKGRTSKTIPTAQAHVVLTTFNARYIHSSLGLRYLYANMGELQTDTRIEELTLALPVEDAVERLLGLNPRIIGFGVYIWNAVKTLEALRLLQSVAPEVTLVVGGPEVSFDVHKQPLCKEADYVVSGQADQSFAALCSDILAGNAPANRLVSSLPIDLKTLASPYPYYTAADLANRLVYVEASRGCPFKCEFCLSSLDKTATPFPLDAFLADMQSLLERGAQHFKFVDRTFNLKVDTCIAILNFFLQYLPGGEKSHYGHADKLFLHFELIPDRLPARLKEKLLEFPDGVLQFEIGIQSFNADVQQLISRRQDMDKTFSNMTWLRENTQAHIHADLIFGLPGESLESFATGFDQLVALKPQEIQLGILKLLRGTPLARHTDAFAMVYQSEPPYRILKNDLLDFKTVQRISRFARYWDLVANSGRFSESLPVLLGTTPFSRFLSLSDWLYATTGQTHKIALPRLFRLLSEAAGEIIMTPAPSRPNAEEVARFHSALQNDYTHAGFSGSLPVVCAATAETPKTTSTTDATPETATNSKKLRQHRHLINS